MPNVAYVDRNSGNGRIVVITAVALLHGAAIYALVTGLAVSYVQEIMPVLTGRNLPLEPPPPPETPKPMPKATAETALLTAPPVREALPPRDSGFTVETAAAIPLNPPAIPDFTFDPAPPSPLPSLAPARGARPRGDPGLWATSNDYPARDLREGNQGVTRFTLTIGADGRVQGCTVIASSGFAGLDQATCRNVSRRARFEAATDGSGTRVAGSYSGSIRWMIPQD